jgi:hypothetical protein
MLMGSGIAATGLGIGLMVDDGSGGWGVMPTIVGIASIGVGIGIISMGAQRQRRYREWQATSPLQPPRRGMGLVAGGVATFFGSGALIAIATVGWSYTWPTPWWGPTGLGLGSAGVVASSFLLFKGGSTNVAFERWRKTKASILPTASVGPQGMQLGLAGRF